MVFWVTEVFPPIVDMRPMVSLSRANIFADGEIFLQVGLDHSVYGPGQPVQVTVILHCRPARRISKLAVILTQAVDVAMFSSGYFKNEVSGIEEKQLGDVEVYQKTFSLTPTYSPGKHWVAIMDDAKEHKTTNFCHPTPRLASSVMLKERSLFMIKVLYFVQVRVSTSRFSRDLILKVPFILAPNSTN